MTEEFDRWWTEHEAEIRRLAKRKYGAQANDAVQDAYVKLKEQSSLASFHSIGGLVRREIHNQWINDWRKRTGRGKMTERGTDDAGKEEGPTHSADHTHQLDREMFKQRVYRFLETADISDKERQAFVAYFFEERTDAEIADAQGASGESGARMRRMKVLRLLRQHLADEGIEAPSELFDLD